MEFSKKSKLGENSYFLSNTDSFFHCFADSGFKNKWTGLWHRETKFLEFLAFRERGEWLSGSTCRGFLYDGARAVHTFRTRRNLITQTAFLPETSHLVVELSGRRPMELEIELAVNIRRRSENRTGRQYSVKGHGDSLRLWNELGSLRLRNASGGLGFEEGSEIREHWPGGEPQNYLVPGRITASGSRIMLVLSPALRGAQPRSLGSPGRLLRERERRLSSFRGLLRSDNRLLEKGFYWSCLATELCRKRGPGLVSWYAGLPWFQHFWARDIFWVVPSLTALGYFRDVRNTLEYFAKASEQGRIPNLVSESEGSHFNALDPTPLWIMSLDDYLMNSGDTAFLKRMKPYLEASAQYILACDKDRDGYFEHDSQFPETWMDTLKRDSKSVELQALCYRALLSSMRLLGGPSGRKAGLLREIEASTGFLRDSLERDFFINGFFVDRYFWRQAVACRTANALVPLLCGFRRHENEVLGVVESGEFTSERGVRTRASGDSGFDPGGYHTGSAWSLTTAWACAAEFLSGRVSGGWRYLRILLGDMERDSLGCIGECWNSSSRSPMGCSLQLWGSGFIPRLVDEFMLGIHVNSREREIRVSPSLPPGTRRIERLRRTGLGDVKLVFSKSGRDVHVSCSNKGFRIVKEPEGPG